MDFNEFHSIKIVKTLSDGSTRAIRGSLDHRDTNVTEGMLFVQFRVRMWLTAAKMSILLPCMGMSNVSTLWTQNDAMPECKISLGPAGTKEHTFDGCVISDWVVSGQKGAEPIEIDIGFIGMTWTTQTALTFFASDTSPAMTEGYTYGFSTASPNVCSLSILGQTVYFPQFRLGMDYKLITEFNNSVTATNICPTDHVLTFATSALYSSCDGNEALLDTPLSGDVSGASLTLDFQRVISGPTTKQTKFVVANAKAVARAPSIKKADFNRLPINLQGYSTSGAALLKVTNIA